MLDDLDRKILIILKKNSRTSFAEISKKIFLSASSVRERVKRMEDIGVIQSYGVVLDQAKLGNTLEVVVMLKIFSGKFQSAMTAINTYPEVLEAFRITGQHNIHMKVALQDQLHLQRFIDKLLGFGEPTTYLILSRLEKQE
jgi:Lrp/AsnC family transcriptional regulator, leucine-responsive regulatory protein